MMALKAATLLFCREPTQAAIPSDLLLSVSSTQETTNPLHIFREGSPPLSFGASCEDDGSLLISPQRSQVHIRAQEVVPQGDPQLR